MNERRSSAGPAVIAALSVLLLPILYLLSVGPAVWLVNQGYLDPKSAELFYAPIIMAAEQFDWFGSGIEWYIDMFG